MSKSKNVALLSLLFDCKRISSLSLHVKLKNVMKYIDAAILKSQKEYSLRNFILNYANMTIKEYFIFQVKAINLSATEMFHQNNLQSSRHWETVHKGQDLWIGWLISIERYCGSFWLEKLTNTEYPLPWDFSLSGISDDIQRIFCRLKRSHWIAWNFCFLCQ